MIKAISAIKQQYPLAEFSCPECGCSDIIAHADNGNISASNPLGEERLFISCKKCDLKGDYISSQMAVGVKEWMVETERVYTCWFSCGDTYADAISTKGIGEFDHGFWVTDEYRLASVSDAVYWIPPSKIDYVKAETKTIRLSEK